MWVWDLTQFPTCKWQLGDYEEEPLAGLCKVKSPAVFMK